MDRLVYAASMLCLLCLRVSHPKHRGISPRALAHVFQEVNARIETAFSVTITYMEIYNEKIFDLLVDPGVNSAKVRTPDLYLVDTSSCWVQAYPTSYVR